MMKNTDAVVNVLGGKKYEGKNIKWLYVIFVAVYDGARVFYYLCLYMGFNRITTNNLVILAVIRPFRYNRIWIL